jgi:endonuclease/exonuclease/phosphatase (EEP) superfamily protein YafD
MKRYLVLGVGALVLLLVFPLLVVLMIIGISSSAAACQQWANQQTPVTSGTTTVTLAQANIKGSLPAAAHTADLAAVVASQPDFVTLNETYPRTDAELRPTGYSSFRAAAPFDARETPVLWRTDAWQLVDSGTQLMHDRAVKWGTRYVNWVTLTSTTSGSTVSVLSAHASPGGPSRAGLLREYVGNLDALITTLKSKGPVLVGGDLNTHYPSSGFLKDWLAGSGATSTFEVLGEPTGGWATGDGGGIIDYILSAGAVQPASHATADLAHSDHRSLTATLTLSGAGTVGPGEAVAGLTATQTQRATAVVTVGRELSIPAKGVVVALAVASQESSFRVLANDGKGGDLAPDQSGIERSLDLPNDGVGSDHGSLGVMQQQWPSWGTMEQLMDPQQSARLFYGALLKVQGWEDLPVTEAAQAVQRSAHPEAYADDETLAQEIYDALSVGGTTNTPVVDVDPVGEVGDGGEKLLLSLEEQEECAEALGIPVGGLTCPPTGSPAEAGLTPDALLVLRCVEQQFGPHTYAGVGERATNPGSDHPAGRAVDVMIGDYTSATGIAEGNEIGEWVRANATQLGVKYVIWRAKIWNVGDTDWSPYSHPSGATDDNSLHYNHVHVSVYGNRGTGFPTGGAVVYPVPAGLADTNQDNWGETSDIRSSWHTGTDFSVPCSTPVLASHAGTVEIDPTQSWAGPQLVKISVGPGQLTTWYAHMQTVTVKTGDTVTPGQQIGEVGNLGNVSGPTGCHLHFEVHLQGGDIYGPDNVDPTPWLAANVGKATGGGVAKVATFNALGHSHTKPGGNKPGWADARERMKGTVEKLNAAAIDIIALQEFEPYQEKAFDDFTAGAWASFPRSGGKAGAANVVAWRTDRWQLVRAERIAIPYFGGNPVRMPYVLLRSTTTGQQVWVGSFHNPADARGPAETHRIEAERREAQLANQLSSVGTPVVFAGDMNERGDYYCRTTAASTLQAANGGIPKPCTPPAAMEIDWIMGSPQVAFTGYTADQSVRGSLSDHALISASITLN